MKTALSILTIITAASFWASEISAATTPVTNIVSGEVLEVKEVESYTYLRLKTKDGETWAAVGKAKVKTGAKVTIENVTVMSNFESKSLKKTFPTIMFGNLAGSGASAQSNGGAMGKPHPSIAKPSDTQNVVVPKASGANARTVAEILTKTAELKDKPVVVSGKVVKFNPGILGKNWIHLRDGSGSSADNTNDIIVTTSSETQVGNVITVKGVVRTDKDLGAGYSYKVLIEDATLQK
ncbi:MAG: nucleotide-binding protein [Rhodocyclaceae bacterium]|nr:nucleotide-binding protein [Rhodocyclaceae bacterium]